MLRIVAPQQLLRSLLRRSLVAGDYVSCSSFAPPELTTHYLGRLACGQTSGQLRRQLRCLAIGD